MQTQNYKSHTRLLPTFHGLLFFILLVCLIGSVWAFFRANEHQSGRLISAIAIGLSASLIILAFHARGFGIAAQDRAIRAEENLRYFVLTGKLLDTRLTLPQVIALRFAEDTEFLILAEKAAKENMKPKSIKQAIVNWKADHHRV